MRQFIAAFCIAIAVFASTPAHATNDSRAFPPDNCSAASPFMGFTGVATSNTFCNSGQDILNNALPACADGQEVAHENGKFVCKTPANVPTCNPNEFLNFDGQTYTCKSTGVATCSNNQVLTYNGSSYFCVNKDATIPVCGANQFLTYNGSYQCASVQTPAPMNVACPSGQVLSGISNGAPVCTDSGSGGASCELDHKVQTINGWDKFYFAYHRNKNGQLIDGQDGGLLQLLSTEAKPNGWQGSSNIVNSPYNNPANKPVDTVDNCVGPAFGTSGGCFTCVNGNWVSGDMGSYYTAPDTYPMPQD